MKEVKVAIFCHFTVWKIDNCTAPHAMHPAGRHWPVQRGSLRWNRFFYGVIVASWSFFFECLNVLDTHYIFAGVIFLITISWFVYCEGKVWYNTTLLMWLCDVADFFAKNLCIIISRPWRVLFECLSFPAKKTYSRFASNLSKYFDLKILAFTSCFGTAKPSGYYDTSMRIDSRHGSIDNWLPMSAASSHDWKRF